LPLTTDELARACEEAESGHLAHQVRALAQLRPEMDAQVLPFAGGTAVLSAPEFGHKLNRVTGAGLDDPITERDLAELEARFGERATALEVDLCPYAQPRSLEALGARGFAVESFTNTYAVEIAVLPAREPHAPELSITQLAPEHGETFIAASVAGFSARPAPRSPSLLDLLARIALVRPHTELFVARWTGAVAATAALALIDTRAGPVAHLFLASTLPAARGRGLQQVLLAHRLQRARALGARLATVAARPGTTSARNTERAGLRLVYNKPTYRKQS
jgi:GNAT superfamily N-acetyltransferase